MYAMADQVIERDSCDARRFLRIGAIVGTADRATATYQYFIAAGGVRQGTFKSRDDDFIAVLFAHGSINPRLTQYQEDRNARSGFGRRPNVRKHCGNRLQRSNRAVALGATESAIRHPTRRHRDNSQRLCHWSAYRRDVLTLQKSQRSRHALEDATVLVVFGVCVLGWEHNRYRLRTCPRLSRSVQSIRAPASVAYLRNR